jgi:hypothetical protein
LGHGALLYIDERRAGGGILEAKRARGNCARGHSRHIEKLHLARPDGDRFAPTPRPPRPAGTARMRASCPEACSSEFRKATIDVSANACLGKAGGRIGEDGQNRSNASTAGIGSEERK